MAYFPERYSPNRLYLRVLVCIAVTVIAGCVASAPTPRAYTAAIERVDQRPGNYYSPRKGSRPLVCFHLRVAASSENVRGGVLRVFLMDLYSPAIQGEPGDSVSFSYAHPLPISGELDFEALDNYRVVRKGG